MKFKSLVSCFLVCALTFGLTACMGSGGSIDSVLKKYGEALNSSDARLVLLLTNWDADSDKYDEIDDYINSARLTRLSGPDCGSCSTYLASTIKLKYSKKDIEVDGDKATVNIKYELLEWNRVNGLDCGSFKKLLEEYKATDDTMTVKGKLSLIKEDGVWKISKIKNLEEVFAFNDKLFYYAINYEDVPVAGYEEAINSYMDIVEKHKAGLNDFDKNFYAFPWGHHDINADGIPEMYFFTEDDTADYPAGTFLVYSYDAEKGKPVEVITCEQIAYESEYGGEYLIYVTYHNEIVIIYTTGDKSVRHVYTDVYDPSFNLKWSFRRDESDKEITFYENNKKIKQDEYESTLRLYMNDANAALMIGMDPEDDDFEEPLVHYVRFLSYPASDADFELQILLNRFHAEWDQTTD